MCEKSFRARNLRVGRFPCAQVINGLNTKRALVEKELLTFGKAPKGIKDIFHQCRNFERAYTRALEVCAVFALRAVFYPYLHTRSACTRPEASALYYTLKTYCR